MRRLDARCALQEYILPVLCGNTRKAHRLSARIYRRYGIVSLICGKPRFGDLFDHTSLTLRLPDPAEPQLCAEALLSLTERYGDMLPLLIPCNEDAEQMIARFSSLLEGRFILSDEQRLFSSSPLSELALRLGA